MTPSYCKQKAPQKGSHDRSSLVTVGRAYRGSSSVHERRTVQDRGAVLPVLGVKKRRQVSVKDLE